MDERLKLLVVDDDEVDRRAVRQALRASGLGAELDEATDREAALERLRHQAFDAVLLDFQLPDRDGISVLRALQRAGLNAPVVLLTGPNDERAAVAWMKAGAVGYLDKSELSAKVLERTLRQALRVHTAEEQQRFLAESLPQLMWIAEADGTIAFLNRPWSTWAGLPPEARGEWLSVFHPEDRPRVAQAWDAALRTAAPFEVEARIRRAADGCYHWHLGKAASMCDARGRALRWLGTFTDIDAPKRAAQRSRFLAEAGAALASSLENSSTAQQLARIAVPDLADLCAVYLRETSYEPEHLALAQVDGPEQDAVRPLAQQVGRHVTGKAPEAAPPLARTEGWLVLPLHGHGETFGALMLGRERAGRRFEPGDRALAEELASRAEVALSNARLFRAAKVERQRAEDASRLKDEFLATLSHELRTPLGAILGWTQVLRTAQLPPDKQERALEAVERNARIQAQLVEDLLDISSIVAGKMRLECSAVEPVAVVEAALDSVRHAAEAKTVQLKLDLRPDTGPVLGDSSRLQQVMWNLLSNAIKFTPAGGQVRVSVQREGDALVIRVTDSGQGIPPDFLPHVFDRFRQADAGVTRVHRGLGLGLSIVRHLVELHGGTVEAESEGGGKGATFCVRLPRLPLE